MSINRCHEKLICWKRAIATGRYQDDGVAASRKALNELFRARICMKHSESNYEKFRRDLSNGCVFKDRKKPHDVSEA